MKYVQSQQQKHQNDSIGIMFMTKVNMFRQTDKSRLICNLNQLTDFHENIPADIYFFKVNIGSTKTMCEIC